MALNRARRAGHNDIKNVKWPKMTYDVLTLDGSAGHLQHDCPLDGQPAARTESSGNHSLGGREDGQN